MIDYRVLRECINVALISCVEKDGTLFALVPVWVVDKDSLLEGALINKTEVVDLKRNSFILAYW